MRGGGQGEWETQRQRRGEILRYALNDGGKNKTTARRDSWLRSGKDCDTDLGIDTYTTPGTRRRAADSARVCRDGAQHAAPLRRPTTVKTTTTGKQKRPLAIYVRAAFAL